jgi:tetratricopeptide (TPR) repeat protein
MILQQDPRDFEALVAMANCEREIGTQLYQSATRRLDKPDRATADVKAAQEEVDRAVHHHAAARQAFEKALSDKPKDAAAMYGLAQLYLSRASGTYRLFTENEQAEVDRHFKAAVHWFEQVVTAEPASYHAHRNLGFAYLGTGARLKARPHFEKYLERLRAMQAQAKKVQPRSERERAMLEAQLTRIRTDIADTEDLIEECELPPPASSFQLKQKLGMALLEQGRGAEASAHLEVCLATARELLGQWGAVVPANPRQARLRDQELKTLRQECETLGRAVERARKP